MRGCLAACLYDDGELPHFYPNHFAVLGGAFYFLLQKPGPVAAIAYAPHHVVHSGEQTAFGVARGVTAMDADTAEAWHVHQQREVATETRAVGHPDLIHAPWYGRPALYLDALDLFERHVRVEAPVLVFEDGTPLFAVTEPLAVDDDAADGVALALPRAVNPYPHDVSLHVSWWPRPCPPK